MLQKKKGFTLIEVLVVMLVATLVFTMVGGTLIFVTNSTDTMIQQSEEINMAKNIAQYLRHMHQDGVDLGDVISFDEDSGEIKNDSQTVFVDTGLTEFMIDNESTDFIQCEMKFESGRQFEFIIGTKPITIQEEGN